MATPVAPVAFIEAEDDTWDDGDSALGSTTESKTTSIGLSILNYRKENGRTYHAYKDGKYLVPNDEQENDRLDLEHHLFSLTFDGKLFTAPVAQEQKLSRVLDVGTGTGIWAIDFADEHPEAQVLGIDLSPIQPSFIPPNLTFQLDDIEEEWTFSYKFDFIYSRMMIGSLSSWPKYFSRVFENLEPGGWVEAVDPDFPYISDDGTLKPDSKLSKWTEMIVDGLKIIGREAVALKHKEAMIAAGFINIKETIYQWPLNQWPKDKKMKEIGLWTNENVGGGLSGLSMALFTRVLGWKPEAVEIFLAEVRSEMNDAKIHAWAPIIVVTGQKPKV